MVFSLCPFGYELIRCELQFFYRLTQTVVIKTAVTSDAGEKKTLYDPG